MDQEGGHNHQNPPSRTKGRQENRLRTAVVPKYSRLQFPTYDSSEDPLVWVHQYEQVFHSQGTMEEDKVSRAAFHMIDEANCGIIRWSKRSQE